MTYLLRYEHICITGKYHLPDDCPFVKDEQQLDIRHGRSILTLITAKAFWKVMFVRKRKRAPLMFWTPSWLSSC